MSTIHILLIDDEPASIKPTLVHLKERLAKDHEIDFDIITTKAAFLARLAKARDGKLAPSHILVFDHKLGPNEFTIPTLVEKAKTILPGPLRIGLSGVMTESDAKKYLSKEMVLSPDNVDEWLRSGLLHRFFSKGDPERVLNGLIGVVETAVHIDGLLEG